jgi:protocatechuate 3,4-dioxygenase beta subunit
MPTVLKIAIKYPLMHSTTPSRLTRRGTLRLLSRTALALMTTHLAAARDTSTPLSIPNPFDAGASSFTVLTPELTEGPFYLDLEKIRRDITESQPGVPLRLRIKVVHGTTGAPIPNAAVDLWHCNAVGVYSGFDSRMRPPPLPTEGNLPLPRGGFPLGGPMRNDQPHVHKPDNTLTFLRGIQLTDPTGMAEIDTIFPGWYEGRTTHIHIRVHTGGFAADGRYRKGHISHTGQIFFPEDVTDMIYRLPAYAAKSGRRMTHKEDGIFSQGGSHVSGLTAIDGQQVGFYSDTLLVIDPAATPNPPVGI